MKSALDKMDDVTDLTHVIIENQISPIATRMKTIQGMVMQHFIEEDVEIICEDSSIKGERNFDRRRIPCSES